MGLKEKSKHVGLSTMANSRAGQLPRVVTPDISFNLNTNVNAADNDIDPDMDSIPPEETDLTEISQVAVVLISDTENDGKTSSEVRITNQDALEGLATPDIVVTSATPAVMGTPEINSDQEESVSASHSSMIESENVITSRNVSFAETLIETILIVRNEDGEESLDEHKFDMMPFSDIEETKTIEEQDMPEEGDNLSQENKDMPEPGENLYQESKDMPEQGENLYQESKDMPEQGENLSQESKDMPDQGENLYQESKDMPEQGENLSQESKTIVRTSSAPTSVETAYSGLQLAAIVHKIDEEAKEREQIEELFGSLDSEFERPQRFSISDETIKSHSLESHHSLESSSQTKSLTQVLKSIDMVVYKDGVAMMWKKFEHSDKEVLVPVPPNSITSNTDNQDNRAIMNNVKNKQKTHSIDSLVKRMLGLGSYKIIMGKQKDQSQQVKLPGIDWTRELEMERFSSQPHYMYKEQWKQNKLQKRVLGPGSYNIKDFIQLANEKPSKGRGACDNLSSRFDKNIQSATPGPGTYGIGGVPQRALEDKSNRSFSTKGMLDTGDRKRDLPFVGANLSPCTYNYKSFTEELLRKGARAKSHLQDFPGDSKRELHAGYFYTPKPSPIGPGYYNFKTFVDEINNPQCHCHGHFGKSAQYPEIPTERIVLFSQQHHSQAKDLPGPATYTIKEFPKVKTVNTPGFLSSAKRDDKMAQKFFAGSSIPVGPGRYNVEKFEKSQLVNGHTNIFKSGTAVSAPNALRSRIQSRSGAYQMYQASNRRTNRSIIGM